MLTRRVIWPASHVAVAKPVSTLKWRSQLPQGGAASMGDVIVRRVHRARLIGQKHTQQRVMDFDMPIITNEAERTKLVHEVAHARPGRADHLRECLLPDL